MHALMRMRRGFFLIGAPPIARSPITGVRFLRFVCYKEVGVRGVIPHGRRALLIGHLSTPQMAYLGGLSYLCRPYSAITPNIASQTQNRHLREQVPGTEKPGLKNGRDVFGASLISPPPRQCGVVEFFQQFIKKGLTPRKETLSHVSDYKLRLQNRVLPAQRSHHPCTDKRIMTDMGGSGKPFTDNQKVIQTGIIQKGK